ncbi:hypothetical protein GCM10017624_16840 [Azotobacter vinelandii]|nr:hypothetical protein GCM10017624_16840 [Azotobacter vinelandii]SFY31878.1 hypothetical protein SAMN04244547_05072 [Azotobacter vinelandii]
MNRVLILAIVALVYLFLSALVMFLLIKLISHTLQSRAHPEPEDDSNDRQSALPQDERERGILSTPLPDTKQDEAPRRSPPSRPPPRILLFPWLFILLAEYWT